MADDSNPSNLLPALADDLNDYHPPGMLDPAALLLDPTRFNAMMQIADIMASGKSTVPVHLRGNPGDCLAIVIMAFQFGVNPYVVADKTFLVSGKLGYEAQLVNILINKSRATRQRIAYEWFGDWGKIIGKFEIKKGDKGEYRVPGWKMADEEGLGIRVSATLRGEERPRELELLLAQARTRNSTLWADDPKQQLAYLGVKRWARLYVPDVLAGVYTPDELEDYTPAAEVPLPGRNEPPPRAAERLLDPYPQELFEKNLPSWRKTILAGKASAAFISDKVSSLYHMSEAQQETLRELELEYAQQAAAKDQEPPV